MNVELRVDGVVVYSSGANVSPVTPPVVPPVAPPPGDRVYPMHPIQLWPSASEKLAASGDSGLAVSFVANAMAFPRGIKLILINESNYGPNGEQLNPTVVISERPHDFTPVGGQSSAVAEGIGTANEMLLRFGSVGLTAWYDIVLNPGQTYYINFHDYALPRGTVYLQLDCRARTD